MGAELLLCRYCLSDFGWPQVDGRPAMEAELPKQDEDARNFLEVILQTPEDWYNHVVGGKDPRDGRPYHCYACTLLVTGYGTVDDGFILMHPHPLEAGSVPEWRRWIINTEGKAYPVGRANPGLVRFPHYLVCPRRSAPPGMLMRIWSDNRRSLRSDGSTPNDAR